MVLVQGFFQYCLVAGAFMAGYWLYKERWKGTVSQGDESYPLKKSERGHNFDR
jgi:hypothetical protein